MSPPSFGIKDVTPVEIKVKPFGPLEGNNTLCDAWLKDENITNDQLDSYINRSKDWAY